jgi:hypothetical protein
VRRIVTFERSIVSLMTAEELRSAEQTLARLVAAAYAADHPEFFGKEATDHTERGAEGDDLTAKRARAYASSSRSHQLTQTTDGP